MPSVSASKTVALRVARASKAALPGTVPQGRQDDFVATEQFSRIEDRKQQLAGVARSSAWHAPALRRGMPSAWCGGAAVTCSKLTLTGMPHSCKRLA